jgi:hypothetical protein
MRRILHKTNPTAWDDRRRIKHVVVAGGGWKRTKYDGKIEHLIKVQQNPRFGLVRIYGSSAQRDTRAMPDIYCGKRRQTTRPDNVHTGVSESIINGTDKQDVAGKRQTVDLVFRLSDDSSRISSHLVVLLLLS